MCIRVLCLSVYRIVCTYLFTVIVCPLTGDGIQRIRYFFPHADEDTVRNVMRQKGNEAASVQQLLEMGYPLKRQTVDVLPIHP